MRRFSIFALLVLSVAVTACENRKAEAAQTSTSAAVIASSGSIAASLVSNDSAAKIGKLIFVGKEHACDCTRKKVDTALAALQAVLGTPPRIPVEMLQADIEEAKVEPYRKQKPMMALPAIYFVDGKGDVLELLQGEITAEQIAAVVKK